MRKPERLAVQVTIGTEQDGRGYLDARIECAADTRLQGHTVERVREKLVVGLILTKVIDEVSFSPCPHDFILSGRQWEDIARVTSRSLDISQPRYRV